MTELTTGLIEDYARALHADWYRDEINGTADDREVNRNWVDPMALPAFSNSPEHMRISFRNRARAELTAETTR